MSVKNELDSFFDRFLKAYQKTRDGLPKCPRNKDADQAVYVGNSDDSGWCTWKPVSYGEEGTFIKLLESYGIEKSADIIDFFSAYHFLGLDISYKKRKMGIRGVDPRDEYRLLKQVINAYTDQDGKITHILIGTDRKVGYSIVVEVKTGIVIYIDDEENKKMRKVASSLEEFIRGWEPRI